MPLSRTILIIGSAFLPLSCGSEKDSGESDAAVDTDTYPEAEDPQVEWIEIPAGSFTFGSPIGTPCRGIYMEKEVPVTLTQPFLMSKYEITQRQWTALGFEVPHNAPFCEECAVTFLDQAEAMVWCNALSHLEGLEACYDLSRCTGTIGSGCPDDEVYAATGCIVEYGTGDVLPDSYNCEPPVRKHTSMYDCDGYRLPTGAEWEYAAKAGTTTNTYNGEITDDHEGYCADEPILNDIAWYCFNSGAGDDNVSPDQIREVGLKQPNPFGLHDMLGNAWEWVDYVGTGFGLDTNEGKPDEALTDPMGAVEDDTRRDIRGGDFKRLNCYNRSAYQFDGFKYGRWISSGFRPVRTLPEGWVDAGTGDSGVK
jgi:formylglycine-generating enzyme required for sulfatase activity